MAASRLCSIPNCGKLFLARGWCAAHYKRWREHGDPLGGQPERGTTMQWLRDHATHDGDECLIWPFARNKYGYATIKHPDRPGTMIAARMMCILAHGKPRSPTDYACHNCNNGHLGCVNLKHLRWDDNRGNQMDRVEAGNSNRGSRHGMAKLTEDDVRQIKALADNKPRPAVAAQFGVSTSAIHLIIQGRTWAWLE